MSKLEHLPAYPTGMWKNAGGEDRTPVIASDAFWTWSREQEKSVKSPTCTGRCMITDDMCSFAVSGTPWVIVF